MSREKILHGSWSIFVALSRRVYARSAILKSENALPWYTLKTTYFIIHNSLIVTVIQPKVIEICEVKVEHGFVKVVLNAGKLHGVIDGEYNIYTPDVADDELAQEVIDRYSINCINVNREDIGMLQSRGATLYQRDGTGITVRAK